MPLYDYRIGSGHGLALGSLTNIENLIWPYVRPRLVAPSSPPINWAPVKTQLMDGSRSGDGRVDHVWEFSVLPLTALDYLIDLLLTTGGVIVDSKACTIYTPDWEAGGTSVRCNAYILRPQPGIDYTRRGRKAIGLRWPFQDLRVLA
jgi:hypothetical protein